MGIAILLHVLAAIVWVGGMFFAWVVLRPVAVNKLEPPLRLDLWLGVFDRFFPWVWAAVLLLFATGLAIIGIRGGFAVVGMHVHIMLAIAMVMTLIYAVVYFVPYRRLAVAVAAGEWQQGGKHLGLIRRLIGINLILGLITAAVASGGPYLFG